VLLIHQRVLLTHQCVLLTHQCVTCYCSGWSEAVRTGWSDLRWMSGRAERWQVCTVLLRQRHVSAVLLWALLEYNSLRVRPWIPQATHEGRLGQAACNAIQMVLDFKSKTNEERFSILRTGSLYAAGRESSVWHKARRGRLSMSYPAPTLSLFLNFSYTQYCSFHFCEKEMSILLFNKFFLLRVNTSILIIYRGFINFTIRIL